MKALGSHLTNLIQTMKLKGFDGAFLTNSDYPGTLQQSLHAHLLERLQGTTHIAPFYLTTYSKWIGEDKPYVKCDFRMAYDHATGFRATNLDVTSGNQYGTIKEVKLPITENLEIPHRDDCNKMVLELKKHTLRR